MAIVKGLTRFELAAGYGITPETFRKRLKREGIRLPPGFITPKWLDIIIVKIGYPGNWKK
jgi:hypothetical protein